MVEQFLAYISEMEKFWTEKYAFHKGDERQVVGRLDSPLQEYLEETENIKNTLARVMHRGDHILDYGCGIGRFKEFLERYYSRYTGVDLINKLPDSQTSFLAIKSFLEQNSPMNLDAIFSSVVLQHITNDDFVKFLFQHFYFHLRVGGRIYLNEQTGDGSVLIRRGFSYLKRRDRNFYISELFNLNFWLEKEIIRGGHTIFSFIKVK